MSNQAKKFNIEDLTSIIQASLDAGAPGAYTTEIRNCGHCILMEAVDIMQEGRGWFRIAAGERAVQIDISSITFREQDRRKGMLTNLTNEILAAGFSGWIIISSVVTDEMEAWCLKNKWEKCEDIMGYRHII